MNRGRVMVFSGTQYRLTLELSSTKYANQNRELFIINETIQSVSHMKPLALLYFVLMLNLSAIYSMAGMLYSLLIYFTKDF